MLRNLSSNLQRVSITSTRFFSAATPSHPTPVQDLGKAVLSETDPEIWDLIQKEKQRQIEGLELIASENFVSKAVLEANGSCLTNKYSEGYPGARYYGGNVIVDQVERLCQKRALEAFHLDSAQWGVNVQPLSGSPANLAVYVGVLNPHDRLMGLDLPHGGHLTHGYMTPTKRISATSIFFESMPYRLDQKTGYIDYDGLAASALLFKPKLIIAGATAYPREIDYKRMKEIADSVGAYLMGDMAHISGMVCAGLLKNSPFDYCDIITSTTHKTLRGPRAGIIFFRKGTREIFAGGKVIKSEYNLEEKINNSVFPALQGGPHEHTIAGIAVALKEAMSPSFKEYQAQILKNAKVLGNSLVSRGYKLVSDGTDTHLVLLDLHPQNIDGSRVEKVLEVCGITVNKNSVPGDTKPMVPGGLRIGTPALTTRGMKEMDFEAVAEFLHRGIRLAMQLNTEGENSSKLKIFSESIKAAVERPEWQQLKTDVEILARKFNMPGHDDF